MSIPSFITDAIDALDSPRVSDWCKANNVPLGEENLEGFKQFMRDFAEGAQAAMRKYHQPFEAAVLLHDESYHFTQNLPEYTFTPGLQMELRTENSSLQGIVLNKKPLKAAHIMGLSPYMAAFENISLGSVFRNVTGLNSNNISHRALHVAMGAHEAYHIIHAIQHPELDKALNQTYPNETAPAGGEDYRNHPLELGAQAAAREALHELGLTPASRGMGR